MSGSKKLPVPWGLDDDVSGKVNQEQSLRDREKRRRSKEKEGKGREGTVGWLFPEAVRFRRRESFIARVKRLNLGTAESLRQLDGICGQSWKDQPTCPVIELASQLHTVQNQASEPGVPVSERRERPVGGVFTPVSSEPVAVRNHAIWKRRDPRG